MTASETTLYRIKPLEWDDSDPLRPVSGHPWGTLDVIFFDGTGWFSENGWMVDSCSSLEDGKAKAEAHYRERLLACLEPVESKKGEWREEIERLKAEVEELTKALNVAGLLLNHPLSRTATANVGEVGNG